MNKIFDNLIFWIKGNKKIAIVGGLFILIIIIVLALSGKGGNSSEFLNNIDTLHNETYTADGIVSISNKELTVNIARSVEDLAVNASCDDKEYNNLYVKTGNAVYVNAGSVAEQGGLLTLNLSENEDAVSLYDTLFEAIANSEGVTFDSDGESQTMVVDTTEGWAQFWQDIYAGLDTQKDMIAAGCTTPEVMKEYIQSLMNDIKKLADTQTIANTLQASITQQEGTYILQFDITMDSSLLPSFAKADDIDSNKVKISGNIKFLITNEMTISKPSGAIHAATADSLQNFLSALWNSMFEKGAYVTFDSVSVTNDTVALTRKLGETTEVCQLVFNTEGVTNAVWYITSPNESIIDGYVSKYQTSNDENSKKAFLKTEMNDGTFSLTITVSENGINSFNKMAKTPKAMGDYLSSYKGGDIIV